MSQATMNVRIGADIAPLQRGLKDAQASVDQSAKLMGTSLSSAATSTDGTRVASEFVRGLQSEFSARSTQLKAALFQGSLTPEQFKREGVIAAQQFNSGITSGLDQFGAQGLLTPETESKMVAKYKRAGLSAGSALNNGMKPALEEGGRGFDLMSHKGEHALLKITGGLMALGAATDTTSPGITRVFKGIEGLALMLAPPAGLVVAALAAGAESITGYFMHARDEIAKTRKAFQDEVAVMVRAGDSIGLQKTAQSILMGDVSGSTGEGGGYRNGLLDVRARLAANKAELAGPAPQGMTLLAYGARVKNLQADQATLTALVAEKERELAVVTDRIKNPHILPRELTTLQPVKITGKDHWTLEEEARKKAAAADSALRNKPVPLPEIADFWQQMKAGGDLVGQKLNLTIEDATANAKLLTTAFGASNDKAALLPRVFGEAEKIQAAALRTLQQWPDPLSDANIKARQLMTTLQPLIEAGALQLAFATHGITNDDPQSVIARNGGFGETGTGKGGIADANVGLIPPKLDTLHTAITAGLNTLNASVQQVGVGIAQTLGAKLAGGSAAGGIGALLGGAAASGALSGLAGKAGAAVGGALGGTVGSVIPVVGTMIGTLAGAAIGKGLGSLFGGLFGSHKKAVDNSATSLNTLATTAQKVSEALSNVPTGFKIASARFDATNAGGGFTLPPVSHGNGGNTFTGDIIMNGVNDPASFYDQLGKYGMQQSARGGTTAMSLAYRQAA